MANGQSIESLLQQGLCLHLSGLPDEAEQFYREVLALDPNHADVHYLLSELARQAGDLQSAQALLEQALQSAPSNPEFHLARGNACAAEGRQEEAITCYRNALCLSPDSADAHFNLGVVLLALGRWEMAEASFLEVLRINPSSADAYNNLGNISMSLDRLSQAELCYRQALDINPEFVDAHVNLGNLLRKQGDIDGARQHFEQAIVVTPSDCLRIKMTTMFSPVYGSLEEMNSQRARLTEALSALEQAPLVPCNPLKEGGGNNFFLVYQGEDDREIQVRLARLYRRLYQPVHNVVERMPCQGRKIRVGFVSSFLRDHTIGILNRGIIANLSRELFEVSVFSIGHYQDAVAVGITQEADHYHALHNRDLHALENFIAQQQMDVLLYTDIGMEPVCYFLAFSRLAPVQCVTWGHPVTTGIGTIDYFISSEHQETADSDQYYSEKLVRLSAIAAYYYPPHVPSPAKGRADYGLPDNARLYLCPHSLFKFHPEFDGMIAAILQRDSTGVFVLMEGHYPQWTKRLKERFSSAMPVVMDRVKFLPRLAYADYLCVMLLADVMLDPLHFGGGKTSLDALSLGVPIVTLPGKFMRGRATYACYRKMQVMDCVVSSKQDYVEKAVAIATDDVYRMELSRKIADASRLLQEDAGVIRELERFFLEATKGL
jgi:protein O-GlcNAc transferase